MIAPDESFFDGPGGSLETDSVLPLQILVVASSFSALRCFATVTLLDQTAVCPFWATCIIDLLRISHAISVSPRWHHRLVRWNQGLRLAPAD